jgi:hypothetical protein
MPQDEDDDLASAVLRVDGTWRDRGGLRRRPPAGTAGRAVAHGDPQDRVGVVHFPSSCAAGVQAELERGIAVLHSFFYDEARRLFTEVAAADPSCAIAQWGVAMSYYHPIWTPPTDEDIAAARAALARAQPITTTTPRERAYLAAMGDTRRPLGAAR